ncbi:ASCH domain containing protein [uncultured Caudovirales phage]|uniref:ASCH domain containing protein n=1 Tax=uncultured Caudovirales phage TaxID=2100421 RepID=A0A6J5NHB4_9CAUD|nr:ASCH domain containing protein [uncultured Caudovirales phage]
MKAISIAQPWIHQIEIGRKTFEVRSQRTNYRGPVLMVATKTPSKWDAAIGLEAGPELGVSVCLADIVDCEKGEARHREGAMVNAIGLWVWKIERVVSVPRVPVQGRLGFFLPPAAVFERLYNATWGSDPTDGQAVVDALFRWRNWGT